MSSRKRKADDSPDNGSSGELDGLYDRTERGESIGEKAKMRKIEEEGE